jgi:hypothetical protein
MEFPKIFPIIEDVLGNIKINLMISKTAILGPLFPISLFNNNNRGWRALTARGMGGQTSPKNKEIGNA